MSQFQTFEPVYQILENATLMWGQSKQLLSIVNADIHFDTQVYHVITPTHVNIV